MPTGAVVVSESPEAAIGRESRSPLAFAHATLAAVLEATARCGAAWTAQASRLRWQHSIARSPPTSEALGDMVAGGRRPAAHVASRRGDDSASCAGCSPTASSPTGAASARSTTRTSSTGSRATARPPEVADFAFMRGLYDLVFADAGPDAARRGVGAGVARVPHHEDVLRVPRRDLLEDGRRHGRHRVRAALPGAARGGAWSSSSSTASTTCTSPRIGRAIDAVTVGPPGAPGAGTRPLRAAGPGRRPARASRRRRSSTSSTPTRHRGRSRSSRTSATGRTPSTRVLRRGEDFDVRRARDPARDGAATSAAS